MKSLMITGLILAAPYAQAEIPTYRGYSQYTFNCYGTTYIIKEHDFYIGEKYEVIRKGRQGAQDQVLKNLEEWEGREYIEMLAGRCGQPKYENISAKN